MTLKQQDKYQCYPSNHQQQSYQIYEQLSTQLIQIEQSNKAYRFYIKNLLKKGFSGIDESNYEMDIDLMDKVFINLKQNLFLKKIKQWHSVKFIKTLYLKTQVNKQIKSFANRQKKDQQESIKQNIFHLWKKIYQQRLKYNQLKAIILNNRNKQLIHSLKIYYRHSQIQRNTQQRNNQIIDRIYQRTLLKKKFQQWGFNIKLIKLKKTILKTKLIQFKVSIEENLRKTDHLIIKFKRFQNNKIQKMCFQSLKQNKNQRKGIKFYHYTLSHKYLNLWIKSTHIQKQYKQIQNSNEIILSHYLEDKQPFRQTTLKFNCFYAWKDTLKELKQKRKKNNLINIKLTQTYNSTLLKKYFVYLKQNTKQVKAKKHYKLQIKSKVLNILQQNLIKQSKKLEKVYEFIEYRKLRRYFYAIQYFNKIQSLKSTLQMQKTYWNRLLMLIAEQYYNKVNKAEQYRNTLLKFKSILALRQNNQLNKNACFCAFSVNIQWPLQRWHKRFKIRNFRNEKNRITLKKAFFQWKVYTITKQGIKLELQIPENKSPYKKINTQISVQNNISSRAQNTSFFQRFQQASSDQDNIDNKIDKLMNKIKNKRSKEKLKQNMEQNFSSAKLQKIRVPTWGSPDEAYHVSVFLGMNDKIQSMLQNQ